MALCGTDVISLEKKNDVAQSPQKLGQDVLIFGELDATRPLKREEWKLVFRPEQMLLVFRLINMLNK